MNAYMKTTKRALAARRALAVSVFTAMLAIGAAGNAAAQDVRGSGNFNPHVNAPPNYDPSSPGIAGPGYGTASGSCQWTREQIRIGGKLTWRPLLQCYYGW